MWQRTAFALAILSVVPAALLGLLSKAASPPLRSVPLATIVDIESRLERPVVAQFRDVPLRDFMHEVGRATGLVIKLDESSLMQEGVTPDIPISITLSKPVKAVNLLKLVLQPLQLDYVPSQGGVSIVGYDPYSPLRQCSYDIADLASTPVQVREVQVHLQRELDRIGMPLATVQASGLEPRGFAIHAHQPPAGHEVIAIELCRFREARDREKQANHHAERIAARQTREAAPFRCASELIRTDICPHIDGPIIPRRNYVYCATFQLAWWKLTEDVLDEPPLLSGDPPMARALNQRPFDPNQISDAAYFAAAGLGTNAFRALIRNELSERFPNSPVPAGMLQDAHGSPNVVIYAHLAKQLAFANDFQVLQKGLHFHSGQQDEAVRAFGAEKFDEHTAETIGKQVTVVSYRDDQDFIIRLDTEPEGDEIILAKVQPHATLADTLASVQQRIRREADQIDRPRIEADDCLGVPILDLKVLQEYPELIGRQLRNAGWEGASIETAMQIISFRLDESGAVLESAAKIEAFLGLETGEPPPPRKLIFDRPFLMYFRQRGAEEPYLVAWIANDELMERISSGAANEDK